jgi:carboxylesterase
MAKQPWGVLILHGFTSSLDCVNGIEPPLKDLGVVTRMPVLRGHGAVSPEALRGVTWHDWLADAEDALQALMAESQRAIVFGHSMGGLLALNLAASHGHQLDSLIVAAAAVQLANPAAPGRPFSFLAPLLTRVLSKWNMPPKYVIPGAVGADPHTAERDSRADADSAEPSRYNGSARERRDNLPWHLDADRTEAHRVVRQDRARDVPRLRM